MILKRQIHNFYGNLSPQGKATLAVLYSIIPLRFRKKKGFWKYLRFLRESQWLSADWHQEYQSKQIKALISHAALSTSYYKDLFLNHKIDFRNIEDSVGFRQIPVLQKNVLVERLTDFLPGNFPDSRLIENSTSGSTGEPFKFHQDYYAVMREEAFAVRHWENAGMNIKEPSIYLRSYVPEHGEKNYHFDRVTNRHYFSAYHLDEKNLNEYCRKIKNIGAKFLFGYPSALEIFADFLLENDLTLKFKAVITGSEMLSTNARLKIELAFESKVFDWYGLAEPTVTMGQCELGNYHVFSEYGLLELLDHKGDPVEREGEIGRIVGTNFTNWALPLIRYDTKDLGVYTKKSCTCGRGTPVLISAIRGRQDDLLIGADGQYLPSVNFYSLFAKLGGEISRFQLIQNDPARFSLKLIRGPEFTEKSVEKVKEGLTRRIGGRPSFDIETVEKITPTDAGKIRSVVREFGVKQGQEATFNED